MSHRGQSVFRALLGIMAEIPSTVGCEARMLSCPHHGIDSKDRRAAEKFRLQGLVLTHVALFRSRRASETFSVHPGVHRLN
jgi:hypothetical protein